MGGSRASSGMAASLLCSLAVAGFVLCLLSGSYNAVGSTSSNSIGGRVLSEEHSDKVAQSGDEVEEMDHADDYELTVSTSITCIVLILIVLTISFEKIKEHIEESAGRNMKPIISSLFGELTVLGFLSIFTFVVTKLGFFESLSAQLFGEEEADELLEIFESVHYALFLVMIFFVLIVLVLVSEAKKTEEEWLEMDRANRDAAYMKKLADKHRVEAIGSSSILRCMKSCFVSVFPSLRRKRNDSIIDQLHFYVLREEFILERSVEPPFKPTAKEHQVSADFNFGRYLSICLEHTLAHIVHLDAITWFSLAAFMVIFYFVTVAVKDNVVVLAWIWMGLGWLIFLLGSIFDLHLLSINHSLVSLDGFFPTSDNSTDPERQNILTAGGKASYSDPSITNVTDAQLPPWCSIDMDAYLEKRSFLTRKIMKVTPNRFDTLFWFERKGPKAAKLVFQIILVFTAVYGAILILTFIPIIYNRSSTVTFIAYLVVSIAPVLIMKLQRRHMAAQMTKVTSVGSLRKPQTVATVIREEKTARVVRAFIILNKMQHATEVGLEEKPRGHLDSELLDSVEMAEVAKAFDSFDHSGDGSISVDDLRQIMSSLGAPVSDSVLRDIVSVLDRSKDGLISKGEFLEFYADHVMGCDEASSIEERAHFMFKMFDRSGDGEISITEFKLALDAFNIGLHVDDIGELIRELDEDEQGTLGEEEFHHLLAKYEPLLRNFRPKDLSAYD